MELLIYMFLQQHDLVERLKNFIFQMADLTMSKLQRQLEIVNHNDMW